MTQWGGILRLGVAAVLLTACGTRAITEQVRARREPVWEGASGSGVRSELSANTNCAEVGEVVTFTVTLANETTQPFTVTGDPLLDIVVQAPPISGQPAPVARWPQSVYYPAQITPVWQPGESRTYQWPWRVDPAFAQQERAGDNVIQASMPATNVRLSSGSITGAGGLDVTIGIGALRTSPFDWIPCADLQR